MHALIAEAIGEAVKAGVFWRAARLNPETAEVWERLGRSHHERSQEFLGRSTLLL